jgi:outer membrane murein-binding lipoprotein Lpp
MKRKLIAILLTAALGVSSLGGCGIIRQVNHDLKSELSSAMSEVESDLNSARSEIESDLNDAKKDIASGIDEAKNALDPDATKESGSSSSKAESKTAGKTYKMADVKKLSGTSNFSKKALEHIFDGTINSKGKATGYHYSSISDSKGKIIAGTESEPDSHGVFTAKVEVDGVKKNGFSSFYPADWSPQEVVDAINKAYDDALSDADNPHGELWIGYSGDLEIDMYLDNNKKITTAYPIYEED